MHTLDTASMSEKFSRHPFRGYQMFFTVTVYDKTSRKHLSPETDSDDCYSLTVAGGKKRIYQADVY